MSQLKAYRTDVQPVYHEKQLIIRTGGFEWIIILIQTVFSKEHRTIFSTYGNEQASNANIKDPYSRVNKRIYDFNEFGDHLYRQYCP